MDEDFNAMTERQKARCPVCRRVVTVTATGALRTHGNREFAGFAQCSKIAYRGISQDWRPDAEGVLCAPPETAQRLWDPRAAVQAWAPSTLHKLKVYELMNVLQEDWNSLNVELMRAREELEKERGQRRRERAAAQASQQLTEEVARAVMGPAVERAMARYGSADVVTRAAVEALMQWVEADHEQG